jgi:hypothetical protein
MDPDTGRCETVEERLVKGDSDSTIAGNPNETHSVEAVMGQNTHHRYVSIVKGLVAPDACMNGESIDLNVGHL